MKGLTLTTREQSGIQVLNGVMEGKVTMVQSAKLMGASEHHTWGVLAAYGGEGADAVAHGNRGRKPATTTCLRTQQKVMELAEGPYAGLNYTHLTEMLAEREDAHLSRSTVRRILLAGGVLSPHRRRAPKRHRRRPALRLQERARLRARRCTHTVQSCDGRARHTDGLRPVTAGEGSSGAHSGNVPGWAGDRAQTRWCSHHRGGQRPAEGVP